MTQNHASPAPAASDTAGPTLANAIPGRQPRPPDRGGAYGPCKGNGRADYQASGLPPVLVSDHAQRRSSGDAPKPFRLLDTDIVLWRDAAGAPAAVRDRSCHRTAKLSLGFVQDGAIACGYHGCVYGADGRLLRMPQAKDPTRATKIKVASYSARDAYGYVWVCLGEPLGGIPDIAESRDPGFQGARAAASIASLMIEKYLFGGTKRPFIEQYVLAGHFEDVKKEQ